MNFHIRVFICLTALLPPHQLLLYLCSIDWRAEKPLMQQAIPEFLSTMNQLNMSLNSCTLELFFTNNEHDCNGIEKSSIISLNSILRETSISRLLMLREAMVAYAKPQPSTNEKRRGRLREERDQIKFIDLRFERWQVVRFRKGRRRQEIP